VKIFGRDFSDFIRKIVILLRVSEVGVEIIILDGKIGVGKILRSGEFWEP
jgi:cobalamin biosynthesis protein CbiD